MAQVIIVGAGPTGATLALLLVKYGVSVILVEASRNFQRQFRGEALMPSGLTALEQMNLKTILEGIPCKPLDGWEFWLNGRLLFRVAEPMETGGKPCTLVSQPHFLAALVEKASHYQQFELIQGEPVRDIVKDEQGRVVGVKIGQNRQIKADLVIAADGRNSVVRQKAGLSLKQFSSNIDILWLELTKDESADWSERLHHETTELNLTWLNSGNIFYSILQDRYALGLFQGATGKLQIGWRLDKDDNLNWKNIDWAKMLVQNSPVWLKQHFQTYSKTITQPKLLSVVVGCSDRWSLPGLLLLGDAVHPLSPIRAQGINMALRDVIVAANYLVPLLTTEPDLPAIDAVLPKIQAEREPEIIRIQQLQAEELAQGELLRSSAVIRWGAKQFAPLIRPFIRHSWLKRQQQLRQGVTPVKLAINYQ